MRATVEKKPIDSKTRQTALYSTPMSPQLQPNGMQYIRRHGFLGATNNQRHLNNQHITTNFPMFTSASISPIAEKYFYFLLLSYLTHNIIHPKYFLSISQKTNDNERAFRDVERHARKPRSTVEYSTLLAGLTLWSGYFSQYKTKEERIPQYGTVQDNFLLFVRGKQPHTYGTRLHHG